MHRCIDGEESIKAQSALRFLLALDERGLIQIRRQSVVGCSW